MNRMTVALIVTAVVVAVVVGVAFMAWGPGKAIFVKPPPPESSMEELCAKIHPVIEPLERAMAEGKPDLGEAEKTQVTEALRQTVEQYQDSFNGRRALARTAEDVRQMIKDARKEGKWELVLTMTDIFGVFRRSEFFMKFYVQLAEEQLARPEVTIQGFFDDQEMKDTYVFLEVQVRGSGEAKTVRVREGEEFLDPPHSLKLLEIVGRNKGVRLEFLAIPGDVFEVMMGP